MIYTFDREWCLIMDKELEKMWVNRSQRILKCCSNFRLEGVNKGTKYFSEDSFRVLKSNHNNQY
jgi:hypothetical protein